MTNEEMKNAQARMASETFARACESCIFSWPEDDNGTTYRCRRKPPIYGEAGDEYSAGEFYWPLVRSRDWCGEFIPWPEEADA